MRLRPVRNTEARPQHRFAHIVDVLGVMVEPNENTESWRMGGFGCCAKE